MRKAPPAAAPQPGGDAPGAGARLYRYLYYGWRFKDADAGTEMERAMASRHNEVEARWLPFYMLRWTLIGSVLLLLEMLSERLGAEARLSAVLLLMLIYIVMYQLLTAIFWAFLRRRAHASRRRV